jgi:hypothetical protein
MYEDMKKINDIIEKKRMDKLNRLMKRLENIEEDDMRKYNEWCKCNISFLNHYKSTYLNDLNECIINKLDL